MGQKQIPILHWSMGQRFLEYCDINRCIPYSKIKFVLRYSFRIPKKHFVSIVKEFVEFGVLEKTGNFEYYISKKFCNIINSF